MGWACRYAQGDVGGGEGFQVGDGSPQGGVLVAEIEGGGAADAGQVGGDGGQEDVALVADIESKLLKAEYKRRQAPPGVKIGTRNFGRDRRYPITNFFHTGPQPKTPR